MDTSETYIKMCEKAVEIQKLRDTKRIGDLFFSQLPIERCVFLNDDYIEQPTHTNAECYSPDVITWLPRQDQLQEMVKSSTALAIAWDFHEWLARTESEEHEDALYDPSMEQLWLAFVMKEKYNKVWNGEEWVKA